MFTVQIKVGKITKTYGFAREADAARFADKMQVLGCHPSLGFDRALPVEGGPQCAAAR